MVVHDKDTKPDPRPAPKPPATEHAAKAAAEVTPMSAVTPPEGYPYIDSLRVHVTLGPWRDAVLHLPNADAIQAIADKWAVDFQEGPVDQTMTLPPPLTDAELAAATAAAEQYAKDHIEPPPEDPPAARDAPRARAPGRDHART
jgi:hypothetical protein